MKTMKYHGWKRYLRPNTELADPNIIPKGTSTYSKSYMAQKFSGGFTDIHGDKTISADRRNQNLFWSASCYPIADPKMLYVISYSTYRQISWSYMERKNQDLRKYEGLNLNQQTTKYLKRQYNLSHNVHGSNFTRHHYWFNSSILDWSWV